MTMPDVTKVQVLAVLQAVVAAAVAFGAPLSQHQQDALLALAAIVAAILIPADVVIRGKRAANADKIKAMTDPTVRSDAVIATIEKLAGASIEEIQAALAKPQPFAATGGTTTTGGASVTTFTPTKSPAKKTPAAKKKP